MDASARQMADRDLRGFRPGGVRHFRRRELPLQRCALVVARAIPDEIGVREPAYEHADRRAPRGRAPALYHRLAPQLILSSPDVTLAPALGSLLLGRPAISVSADLYGGNVSATIYQRAGATNLSFVLSALSLAQSEPLRQLGTKLDGNVSGIGTAELKSPLLPDNTARITLDSRDVVVEIVDGAPPIRLGTVSGIISLQDGVVTMHDVEAHGGDLEVKAEGTLRLDPDIEESDVEMQLSLVPTPSGREHFGLFLKMLPHPPEEGPYDVSGPLMSPNVT